LLDSARVGAALSAGSIGSCRDPRTRRHSAYDVESNHHDLAVAPPSVKHFLIPFALVAQFIGETRQHRFGELTVQVLPPIVNVDITAFL